MSNVGKSVERSVVHQHCNRQIVYADVLRNLVVGALQKSYICNQKRISTVFRDSGANRSCRLLRDSNIKILRAELFTKLRHKPDRSRHGRSYNNKFLVFFGTLHNPVRSNRAVAFAVSKINSRLSCRAVKRKSPVPCFLVFFRNLVAFSLQCVDVKHNRVVNVLYLFKKRNHHADVVSIFLINIVKTERAEHIVRRFSVCFAEFFQILVDSAVIFRNRNLVVVHNNDEI